MALAVETESEPLHPRLQLAGRPRRARGREMLSSPPCAAGSVSAGTGGLGHFAHCASWLCQAQPSEESSLSPPPPEDLGCPGAGTGCGEQLSQG